MGFFVGKAVSNRQPETFGCEPGKAQKPQFFLLSPQKLTFTLGKKEENGRFPHGITIPTRRGRPARTTSPARIPGETKSQELNPTLEPFVLPAPLFPLSPGICAGIEGNSREGFGARSGIFNPFVPSPRRGAGGSRPWLSPVAAPAR